MAEVAHSHASVDNPIGMRCWFPAEDCVTMNSLQVVAARDQAERHPVLRVER